VSVLLRVAYDGTDFHGFARQADDKTGTPVRTVAGTLEGALADVFGVPVPVRGASRTDAGVHAQGQLVAFDPPHAIPAPGVARALADRLPTDVTVTAAWEEDDPDVRGGNLGKHYRYRIRCTRAADPMTARYEWHYGRPLDPAAMQRAAWAFAGTHDFGSFRAAGCQASTSVRTIEAVTVTWRAATPGVASDAGGMERHAARRDAGVIEVDVRGTAFLYNMVRIMVGALVEVGRGFRPVAHVQALLEKPDRAAAGPTAPAGGLVLVEVRWPTRDSTWDQTQS
jgi:tRNA pseudouridine38-40 synthase